MKKNHGYTLIEMLIVLAIIVILSGVSFVTIGIIKQAKYNAAATTLSDQIGSLLVKTRALSEAKTDRLCMQIRYNDSEVTYADGTYAKAGTYSLILGYHVGNTFVEKTANTAEATLPEIIEIEYDTTDSTACDIAGVDDTTNMIIEFNKSNGSVRFGSGNYNILFNGRCVATVYLDSVTGNHYIK
ncbi:MAG: type II secretion system GspH family protein [Clostridium sp.]|nr:type II secretion system GspH family protein [Clostridium sp.]